MLKIDKGVLSLKRYIQCAVPTEDIELHYRESAIGGFVLDAEPVDINSYVNKFDSVVGDPESQYALFLKRCNISGTKYETVVFIVLYNIQFLSVILIKESFNFLFI